MIPGLCFEVWKLTAPIRSPLHEMPVEISATPQWLRRPHSHSTPMVSFPWGSQDEVCAGLVLDQSFLLFRPCMTSVMLHEMSLGAEGFPAAGARIGPLVCVSPLMNLEI